MATRRGGDTRQIWLWSGRYQLDAVGESFHYEDLSSFDWPIGFESAVYLCAAELLHEPYNSHDANAIAVRVQGRSIGHLSREDAAAHHERLSELGVHERTTWANCIIIGSRLDEPEKRFSVQIDLAPESVLSIGFGLAHDKPVMLPDLTPVFVSKNGYGFAVANWLSRVAVDCCRPGDRLKVWRKPESDELYLYAPGSIGGTGRVLVVTDELLTAFGFTDLSDFEPIVYSVGLRELTICFKLPARV